MITPAYALTATERVLPRMALDFTTGVLDSRVTVTRALNTATAINSSGFIAIVNANLPRFDYDPVTLAPKGLLIEEARTNLLTYSEDFTDASWIKDSLTITSNSTVSPDGTSNADTVTPTTSNTPTHRITKSVVTVAGSVTISVFVKQNGYSKFYIREGVTTGAYAVFDIANGTIITQNAGTGAIVLQKNGFYRVSLTLTTTTTTRVDYGPLDNGYTSGSPSAYSYAGNGVSGVYIWGAQLEAGAFATSYIPTTTTSLTRNADVVSMTGTNFSDWYNASEGTFVVGFDTKTPTSIVPVKVIISANVSSAGSNVDENRIITYNGQIRGATAVSGVTYVDISTGTYTVGAFMNVSYGYATNNFGASLNAAAVVTDTSGPVPLNLIALLIGSYNGGNNVNGHIGLIRYYPTRLTNAQLQAFSK